MGYSRIARHIALALGPMLARYSRRLLRRPVFVVGFNKSAKSLIVSGLEAQRGLTLFPGEGNAALWFGGFYPWWKLQLPLAPLWADPDAFIQAVVGSRPDGFRVTRAQLGLYQLIRAPASVLVNDSGMLAALMPEILPVFPDAKVVHIVRDGRVVSWLAAKKTMRRISVSPGKYLRYDCPVDFDEVLDRQARYWCWTIDQMEKFANRLPDSVLTVRYEDWCARPMKTLEEIMRFIGLEGPLRSPSWPASIENYNGKDLAGISTEQHRRFIETAGPQLRRLGYNA
jgi:hypothetical protein